MSGASSPSCARIHTQYKLGRGTEFLGFFLKPNMIPSFQKLQTRFRLAWETILQLSLSWAGNTRFASLDSRSRLCGRRAASAARTRYPCERAEGDIGGICYARWPRTSG